jgi:hypothetical protein
VHGLLLDVLGKVNGDASDLRQGVTMLLLLLLPVMAAAKMARNISPHSMNTYLELKIEAVNEILEEDEGVPTLINEYRVSVGNQAWGGGAQVVGVEFEAPAIVERVEE